MSMRPAPQAAASARASRALYDPSRLDQVLETGRAYFWRRKKAEAPPPQPKPLPPEVLPYVKTISMAKLDDIMHQFMALDVKHPGWSGVFFEMTNAKHYRESGYVMIDPKTLDPDAELAKMIKSDDGSFFKYFSEKYGETIRKQRSGEVRSAQAVIAWSRMSGVDTLVYGDPPLDEDLKLALDKDLKLALQLCAGGDFDFDPFEKTSIGEWKSMFLIYARFLNYKLYPFGKGN